MPTDERATSDLLERLLTDADFRADFRRDPAAAAAAFGLDGLAAELAGAGAIEALEPRESRSSLAGVLFAAAAEGVGVAELARHFTGRHALAGDAARALDDVVARLRGVPSVGSPAPAPGEAAAQRGGAAHVTPPVAAAPAPAAAPVAPAAPPESATVPPARTPPVAAVPAPHAAPAHEAAAPEPVAVAYRSSVAPAGATASEHAGPAAPIAPADMAARDEGGHLHASEFAISDPEGAPGPHGNWHAGYDLFARPGSSVRSPIAGVVVEVKASRGVTGQIFGGVVKVQGDDGRVWVFRHVDPGAVAEGAGVAAGQELATVTHWADGPPHVHIEIWKTLAGGYTVDNMEDPLPALELAYAAPLPDGSSAVAQLLDTPAVALSEEARADLAAGKVDPRLVAVLGRLAERHRLGIGTIETGHDRLTDSGSVSNHVYGRAVDITSVDGEPVNSANAAARELVQELGALEPSLRPTEIGSPWNVSGPEFFTDADHQDHLHVAYDTAAPPQTTQPEGARPPGTLGAVPVVPDTPAAPGPAVAAPAGPGGTLSSIPVVQEAASQPDAALGYPGDGAAPDAVAVWMSARAREAGLPGELPVMAGLVESSLRNLDHGDADSVGFFQMRVSIWNQGEYAGYPDRPELQLRWFVEHALAVRDKRLAEGLPDPTGDPGAWGEWIADVERPAEEYRGRYQEHLAEARQLLGLPG